MFTQFKHSTMASRTSFGLRYLEFNIHSIIKRLLLYSVVFFSKIPNIISKSSYNSSSSFDKYVIISVINSLINVVPCNVIRFVAFYFLYYEYKLLSNLIVYFVHILIDHLVHILIDHLVHNMIPKIRK